MTYDVRYASSSACGVPLPENTEILLIGLQKDGKKDFVSIYNTTGPVKDVASLNVGRQQHTCGGFIADDGIPVNTKTI